MKAMRRPNRLIKEKSPYLLQHAYNPVDWYPWSQEAFESARAQTKPVFLSIGYSTCHWCHVMEEESFSDDSVAKILNEHFVPVKVDREERPDVDQVYMDAVMTMTGTGGWPLNVFLTPDLFPFYGGTYFPPDDRYGRPGFSTLLLAIAQKWSAERDKIIESGRNLADAIREHGRQPEDRQSMSESILDEAFHQFAARFDRDHGGFGGAPKFPSAHNLSFLLYYFKRTRNDFALQMVEKSLDAMARGGVYDHLGGGFHRYSTDERWHVPHFEKMLYDQALLSRAYAEAYQMTRKDDYQNTALEIFQYVMRDLTNGMGAFLSAEDADSAPDPAAAEEKKEGAFYVWDADEIKNILSEGDYRLAAAYFNIKDEGNVLQDPFGEFKGKNVLYRSRPLTQAAQSAGTPEEEAGRHMSGIIQSLFARREKRPRPHLDDKVLTDWNGLMIASLAYASRAFDRPDLAQAAERAALFIMQHMKDGEDGLFHRWRDGEAAVTGFLDDYAFFTQGLFELYEATFKPLYLEEAVRLAERMIRLFWDERESGFFFSAQGTQPLFSRPKPVYDGAVPSGNSVAIGVLAKLGRLTGDKRFEEYARLALDAFSGQLTSGPALYPSTLQAFGFLLGPVSEIVIAGPKGDPCVTDFVQILFSRFNPDQVVARHPYDSGEEAAWAARLMPFIKEKGAVHGKPAVYICRNYACQAPVTEPEALKRYL